MRWSLLLPLALLIAVNGILSAQTTPTIPYVDKIGMHQHYDAAYHFQSSGDVPRADAEHKRFLAAALNRLANFYANTGDYREATPTYAEALQLIPNDFTVLMDSAGAALDAHDPRKAKSLLETVVSLDLTTITRPEKADVHLLLGRTLHALDDKQAALDEIDTAIALNPNIDGYCARAGVVLDLHGAEAVTHISDQIVTRFGDSAAVHMRIGRMYALSGFPDRAIEEFKKAVARDYKTPDAHYSLGAAYMSNLARDLPLAKAEFRKELDLHPDDIYSYPQLGYIALRNLDYREAEIDFRHALTANPINAQVFADLGKLYVDTNRPAEAEAAFRKAIALTIDPSQNEYGIERVHYQLGRLLIARGEEPEGQQELQIAQQLLSQRDVDAQSKLAGKPVRSSPLDRTRVATLKEIQELKVFAKQIQPLIAGSYNNLGVHAATAGEYVEAAGYFRLAAGWDPALRGVDKNWGMAAYAAHDCAQAMQPLGRAIAADSSNAELTAMLKQCQGLVRSQADMNK